MPFIGTFYGVADSFENFLGKTQLINAYTEFRLLVGDRVFNRTIVGPGNWINLTDDYAITGYQNTNPLSQAELSAIRSSLEKFRNEVESQGAVFMFVVAPDKQTIYPENVPYQISKLDGYSRLDQLTDYLKSGDNAFPILDLRPVLMDAKQEYPVYYATDTHWTSIGAFFAYQEMIDSLHPKIPGLLPHKISDYEITYQEPILFNINKIIGSVSLFEQPIVLDPIFNVQAREFAIDLPMQNNTVQMHFSHTGDLNAPVVLVFEDSFFINLRPFVSEHFSQAIYVHHLTASTISYRSWVNQFSPDIVIFEITERNIGTIKALLGH